MFILLDDATGSSKLPQASSIPEPPLPIINILDCDNDLIIAASSNRYSLRPLLPHAPKHSDLDFAPSRA